MIYLLAALLIAASLAGLLGFDLLSLVLAAVAFAVGVSWPVAKKITRRP